MTEHPADREDRQSLASSMPVPTLDELLEEPIASALTRESTTLEQSAGNRLRSIVLFGAGGAGLRALGALRAAGNNVVAFSDNSPSKAGVLDGVPVLRPDEACRRYGKSSVFIVTLWNGYGTHTYAQIEQQLVELGATCVVPYTWLTWRHPEELHPHTLMLGLPSEVLRAAPSIRAAYALLSDDPSRVEFLNQLRWRLGGDPRELLAPVETPPYLAVGAPTPDEVVADCGAFDGDTLALWLHHRGDFSEYLAIEADPSNVQRLEARLRDLPPWVRDRVQVLAYAVSDRTGVFEFEAHGTTGSALASASSVDTISVDAITIDELFSRRALPSFVKMDIEGAELQALSGGKVVLEAAQPLVAVASYHHPADLWELPLAISEVCQDHGIYFRCHQADGWDLVCYAVPPGRVPSP
jgi:FkbM family methyltransferase